MNRLRLEDLTQAYRVVHSTELDSRKVLTRVRTTLDERAQGRSAKSWKKWSRGAGLSVALGGSIAYASPFADSLVTWLEKVTSPSSQGALDPAPNARALATGPVPPDVHAPAVSIEAPASDEARQAEVPRATSASPPASPRLTPAPSLAAHRVGASPGARPSSRVAPATTEPNPAASSESTASALYSEAQRLQFIEHDYRSALAAWDEYLSATNDTALRADGEYGRAVCLLHLSRYAEAREALTRLSGKGAAPSHRARALTLLESLEHVWEH